MLHFLSTYYTGVKNVKSVFDIRPTACFYKDRNIFSPLWLRRVFKRVLLSLTYYAAWSHGNCPGALWYMPCAWNCDYTPNALDGRSIKAGEGKESTGEEAESRWWYSVQFKCILLVLSISHIMLGQARGQFLFSRGFKRQIYCITGGEYKISKSEPSGFQSDNSDTMLFV